MTGEITPYNDTVMKTRKRLLTAIDNHLNAKRISGTKLCHNANVDHHVIRKLRTGESISLRSIEKLETAMSTACPQEVEAAHNA